MDEPKKWHTIYPYGSKDGDEEAKVFKSLARHPKFTWRSTAAIVKDTGLSRARVEEIIDKYTNKIKPALIYAHPSNEDHWGYWERVPEVLKKDNRGVSKKDKDNRINKQITGNTLVQDVPQTASEDNQVCSKTSLMCDAITVMVIEHHSINKNNDLFQIIMQEVEKENNKQYQNLCHNICK